MTARSAANLMTSITERVLAQSNSCAAIAGELNQLANQFLATINLLELAIGCVECPHTRADLTKLAKDLHPNPKE